MKVLSTIPEKFTGPAAWVGKDLQARQSEWLYTLNADEISEIEHAAQHYLRLGRDVGEITAKDFPLPKFSNHLREMSQKLLHGIGVEVIRNLPVKSYSQEMAAAIFCGLGAHLGSARSQNAAGHILGHVRDIGARLNDPSTRIYQTSERGSFHTDSADVVALMCLQDAKEGGDSLLVSAETIYNLMRATRPDLLALLFDPIATDRRGEVPSGMKPYMTIPPFSWHDGRLTVFYQRQYIDSAQRFPSAMRLSPDHIEALDYFDDLANNTDLHIKMRLVPGDMQFVYNHAQLHDRTEYVDWPEHKNCRHIFRLWLSMAGDRALPECFKQRFGSIRIGDRGGIITSATRLHAPLD